MANQFRNKTDFKQAPVFNRAVARRREDPGDGA